MSDKRCPRCNGPVISQGHKLYRCDKCKMLTDCEDDGDVGYRMPETNVSKKEEFEIRQRDRQQRRRQQQNKPRYF